MPPCIAMGEAAGVATCQSLEKDITPREIDIKELQVELIKTGGNLGQAEREVAGILVDSISHDLKYINLDRKEVGKVVVKNASTEFTGK